MKRHRWTGVFVFVLLMPCIGVQAQTSSPPPSDAPPHPALHAQAARTGQSAFYLESGDRVLFYGDSITQQRFYTMFVESYVVTRFPYLDVSFVNSGWGGDSVTGGKGGPVDLRLQRDVIPYKPTVITVMLGMNDGRYRPFDPDLFHTYTSGYEDIVQRLRHALPGLRMTLIEPSPYDDVTRPPAFGLRQHPTPSPSGSGGYNSTLLRFSEFVKQLAAREGLQVADLNSPVVAMLEKAKSLDAELAQTILPDRVHPAPGGHLVMAAALLKAWNAPAIVSSVRINAETKKVERVENARVSDLNMEKDISWMQTDFALPMPIDRKDPVIALVLKSSNVFDSLNQELLAVSGLHGEKYTLKIDGKEIGSFSGQQLGAGVNLADLHTPMSEQAEEVNELTLKRNSIHFARWRSVQVPFEKSPGAADKTIKALDELDRDLARAQHNTARPLTHSFEVSPAA